MKDALKRWLSRKNAVVTAPTGQPGVIARLELILHSPQSTIALSQLEHDAVLVPLNGTIQQHVVECLSKRAMVIVENLRSWEDRIEAIFAVTAYLDEYISCRKPQYLPKSSSRSDFAEAIQSHPIFTVVFDELESELCERLIQRDPVGIAASLDNRGEQAVFDIAHGKYTSGIDAASETLLALPKVTANPRFMCALALACAKSGDLLTSLMAMNQMFVASRSADSAVVTWLTMFGIRSAGLVWGDVERWRSR
jgi:hypothetical protein